MPVNRKERREQERLEAKVAKRALPLYPDTPARAAIRLRYATALATGTSHAQLVDRAHRESDTAGARAFAATAKPSCAVGCAHCCSLFISVRAPEARALAAALRRLPKATLEDVRRRVKEGAANARGQTSGTCPRRPCALLSEEGTCRAYEARPFSCREYHSYDVATCRRAAAGEDVGVPSNRVAFGAQRDVSVAYIEAAASSGAEAATYELHQSLDLLLSDPTADLGPARELTEAADLAHLLEKRNAGS
jgi:Fe-S-cluster containining protein